MWEMHPSMFFGNTIDSVRYVYSLYPEAAKFEISGRGETFLHAQRRRQVRKYSPRSQLLPEYIGKFNPLPYIYL
jgi:hypothetical protein